MAGKQVCYNHGGRTPSGIASPHWRDGRYSRVLPTRLIPRYQQARDDRELGSLTHEVHLLDVRIGELVEQLEPPAPPPLELGPDLAPVPLDPVVVENNLRARWAEIRELIDERRKLVESERKRLVELQQIITLEQANSLIVAIAESVKRHVSDRAALQAISADIGRITGRVVSTHAG